ncbi:MAG: AI-2E family transporter [Halanaerobiaceae bacterium]
MHNLKKKDIKIAIMLLFVGSIIYFLLQIKEVLLPFLVGIILAYLFYPVVCFLRRKKVSKTWAIYILIILFLILAIIISVIIFPLFLSELARLTETIPEYVKTIDNYISYLNSEYKRVQMPPIIKEVLDRTLNKSEEQIISFMENLTENIINSLSYIVSLVIAPFITYYLLKDLSSLKKSVIKLIPRDYRRLFFGIGVEINRIFVGYLRGQIWISIIVGILTGIALLFFNIRFTLLLSILAGMSNMVPFIGPIIGSFPAIFIALLSSPGKALSVALLFFVIQQLESSLISPKIMSDKVGMHPLLIIFSLMVGASLFGIWGLLLAIPAAGSIKVLLGVIFNELI